MSGIYLGHLGPDRDDEPTQEIVLECGRTAKDAAIAERKAIRARRVAWTVGVLAIISHVALVASAAVAR